MKIFSRIFRLFNIKGNKLLKKHENAIEIFEYELGKSKNQLDKLSDSQAEMRGKLRSIRDDKAAAEKQLPELQRILDSAYRQGDDAIGEEACVEIEKVEKRIEMHQTAESTYERVLKELELQYDNLKTKHSEKLASLDTLRAKNEFAKNMESINQQLKLHYSDDEFDFTNLEKIEKDLNEKMYIEEEKNKQLTPEMTLQQRITADSRKSKFQQYKEQRQAEEVKSIDAPKVTIDMIGQAETVKVESK